MEEMGFEVALKQRLDLREEGNDTPVWGKPSAKVPT